MTAKKRDRGQEVNLAGINPQGTINLPAKRDYELALDSQVLPGSNVWVPSESIDVRKTRYVHFYVTYAAAAAGGQWGLLPEVHGGYREDGTLGEKWFPISRPDPAVNEASLAAVPPGGDSTGDKFDQVTMRPVVYIGAATTGGDTVTAMVTVNVESAQLLRVSMAEMSGGSAGTMSVRYTKSS